MTRNIFILSLWMVVATPTFGDTLVVPNNQTAAPGTVPFPLPATPFRFQEVVGSGQFTTPVVITGFRLRAAPGTGPVNANYSSYKVTLSTTQVYPNIANGHALIGNTYANNVGPDATVVYNGPLSWSSPGCPAPGPCALDLAVAMSTSFSYDPGKGRLLVDVVATPSGTSTGAFDAVGFTDLTASTVGSVSGDPTAATGTFLPGGVVLGLDLQAGGTGVSLAGSFGFLWNASFIDPTYSTGASILGTITFDGSGNTAGTFITQTSGNDGQAPQTITGTFKGAYKTNSDGTGTATAVADGGGGTTTLAFVVTDGGQGAQMTVTNLDSGLPQGVLSGIARATYTGTLKGTYGFQLNNNPRPASTIGWITFDGAGGATVSFLSAGPGDMQPQVSTGSLKGTYTLNKDGTGSVKLAAGGAPAGTFAFVVTDGGSGMLLMMTDGTTANVSSGMGRLQ